MIQAVILWLEQLAGSIPLPLFVVLGGLLEEVIAPIPSPLVATITGTLLSTQQLGIPYLLFICALATVAKTVGAWLFYVLGDKLEDVAVPRFGKYIGVSHDDLEHFGEHFKGTHRDAWVLLGLRSVPVMPSTPISVICGILKINLKTFILSTYIGFYIRNLFFILLGFEGLGATNSLISGIDTAETVLKLTIVFCVLLVLGWFYWKRSRGVPVQLFQEKKGE